MRYLFAVPVLRVAVFVFLGLDISMSQSSDTEDFGLWNLRVASVSRITIQMDLYSDSLLYLTDELHQLSDVNGDNPEILNSAALNRDHAIKKTVQGASKAQGAEESDSMAIRPLGGVDLNQMLQDSLLNSIRRMEEILLDLESQKASEMKEAGALSQALSGSFKFEYRGVDYLVFIPRKEHEIRFHLKNDDDDCRPFRSIGKLKQYLIKHNEQPLMIMNAGMYMKSRDPQGLYIEEYDQYRALDLSVPEGLSNFYLKPNGVFFIDSSDQAAIQVSEDFDRYYSERPFAVRYATQSGPMLVVNGQLHEAFNYRSSNLHYRNGVGISEEGGVVFLMSTDPVNFYDFATVFKDLFRCNHALYLDGAISRMYLHDLHPMESGGDFGPMISVVSEK